MTQKQILNKIGFGNAGTSNVFGGGAQNSLFGKPQQPTPAFGTQTSTPSFGMNTAQPSIFGSNTAQTSKPFGGNFERVLWFINWKYCM